MPKSDTAIVMKSWVEAFSDKMYLWTLYKTNSKETAEDLVQDTFLAAFQSIEKFEGKSEPKTWLFSILNNKIAEHFRKAYCNPPSMKVIEMLIQKYHYLTLFLIAMVIGKKNSGPKNGIETRKTFLIMPNL